MSAKRINDAAERLEKEIPEFIKYLNDEVVPAVRTHSTKALRVASEKLSDFADYMEKHPHPPSSNAVSIRCRIGPAVFSVRIIARSLAMLLILSSACGHPKRRASVSNTAARATRAAADWSCG